MGAGGQGRGGDGGGGLVHGNGMVIGGDGGSVDGEAIWYPPAKSAYDRILREQGETPDFGVMYPGYGGMSGGYLVRQNIVVQIRSEYFRAHGNLEQINRSKIGDVPLGYVNQELEKRGLPWRARLEGDWYIYFIPE